MCRRYTNAWKWDERLWNQWNKVLRMMFSKKRDTPRCIICVNGLDLEQVDEFQYLGSIVHHMHNPILRLNGVSAKQKQHTKGWRECLLYITVVAMQRCGSCCGCFVSHGWIEWATKTFFRRQGHKIEPTIVGLGM